MFECVGWHCVCGYGVGGVVVATVAFSAIRGCNTVCRGCGKVRYVQPEFGPEAPEESYRTEETVLIVYSGDVVMRVTGCKSGHLYMFAPGVSRHIDIYDAGCIVDMSVFEYGTAV